MLLFSVETKRYIFSLLTSLFCLPAEDSVTHCMSPGVPLDAPDWLWRQPQNLCSWRDVHSLCMHLRPISVGAVPQMVHITPHGGVAPPVQSQNQSGQQQQQQQTPQQPTSSGHQTPTPSQHTPYAVQQVGPGVATPPQTHIYHAIPQHPVIAQQGPAPPSPQVHQHVLLSS